MGKTHLVISLAAASCRQGHNVRFFTAAALVNLLEEKQKAYLLGRCLTQLDRTDPGGRSFRAFEGTPPGAKAR